MNSATEQKINTVVHLEQKNDSINMKVLKMHGKATDGINLKLDPKTLLMAEK